MRIFAIGDVHGYLDNLKMMIKEARLLEPDKFVLLGDLIDRGPDVRGTINYVKELKEELGDNLVICRGNHDAMMLEPSPNGFAAWRFSDHGAKETMESYVGYDDDFRDHLRFLLDNTVMNYVEGKHFFVHAGINPWRPLAENDESDFLWIRRPFLDYPHAFENDHYVVHGHTIVRDVDILNNRCNLDVGCYKRGNLCGALFDTNDVDPRPVAVVYAKDTYAWRIK